MSEKKLSIPAMIYSRVSGYYNPVVNFNKGKAEEFSERKYVKVPEPEAIPYRASTRTFNTL